MSSLTTLGYCYIDYLLPESMGVNFHISTCIQSYNCFDQFIAEQTLILQNIRFKKPIYLDYILFCYLNDLSSNKAIKYYKIDSNDFNHSGVSINGC